MKCPYCGATADKLELNLKAYVPVILNSSGTFELEPYSQDRDDQIWDSIIDCLYDENKDVYCTSCGNVSKVIDTDYEDNQVHITELAKMGAHYE